MLRGDRSGGRQGTWVLGQDVGVDGLRLRWAGPGDVGVVRGLILALAEYERLLDQAVVTEDDLRRSLFGERAYGEVILAERGGRAVGFALFFHNFSTFLGKPGLYLEDLYVVPEERGRGVGGVLLGVLARIALNRGCGRFEWSVLDWNEPSIRFYESLGARAMDDWTVYRVEGRALSDLAARGAGRVVENL